MSLGRGTQNTPYILKMVHAHTHVRILLICAYLLVLIFGLQVEAGKSQSGGLSVLSERQKESNVHEIDVSTNKRWFEEGLREIAELYVKSTSPRDLFPRASEPIKSQLLVFTLAQSHSRQIAVMYDGHTMKREPPSIRPWDWGIVKTANTIIIPNWTRMAKLVEEELADQVNYRQNGDKSNWSDVDKLLKTAKAPHEQEQIREQVFRERWAHMPNWKKKNVVRIHNGDEDKAMRSSAQSFLDWREDNPKSGKASFLRKRVARYLGLDLFRLSFITIDVDGEGNTVITKNESKMKEMDASPARFKHKTKFLQSWDESAE